MAQYEHLPIYKKAYDLTLYFEKIVRNFSRYDKYTIGADLRQLSRDVLRLIRPPLGFDHEIKAFMLALRSFWQ